MLTVDNSRKGNCMYYAYSISLMYFLRARNDQSIINNVFRKLNLDSRQQVQLQSLLSKDPSQEFTKDEIKKIIEPILSRATRNLVAHRAKIEFISSPQDTSLFVSAQYGLGFYFKIALKQNKSKLTSLINHLFNDPNYTQAELYKINGAKIEMTEYVRHRVKFVIEEFSRIWKIHEEIAKKDKKSLTKAEVIAYKTKILDNILRNETVNYFLENNKQRLNQYTEHLQSGFTSGTEESLFILHRAIQDERIVRKPNGTVVASYDNEILLHIHKDGSSPFAQHGTPEMILDNSGNAHWISKIPETIFTKKSVSEAPAEKEQEEEPLQHKGPPLKKHQNHQKIQEYAVMGAGIAGTMLALELSQYLDKRNKTLKLIGKEEKPYKITIIDKRDSALAGSSDRTPCRLGLGFHYADYESASKYYRATSNLLKKYRARGIDLRLHIDPAYLPHDEQGIKMPDPLHRGRYCLVKDSVMPPGQVFTVYDRLKNLYKEDCDIRDESGQSPNKLFGEPEDFYKLLTLREISKIDSSIVNKDRVTAVVETAECILNWPLLRKTILDDIESNPHIELQTNANIQGIVQKDNPLDGYTVTYKNAESMEKSISADVVVNATWENISYFNQQLGISPQAITNRLKIMIAVDLPESLQKEHCLFFCFGPHASFTNTGNGTGFITAEKFTNYLQSTGLKITSEMEKMLYGLPNTATEDEVSKLKAIKEDIARNIIEETAKYIPAMKNAKIKVNDSTGELAIYSGIVRTPGIVKALDSATSCIHQRSESGVAAHKISGLPNYFEDASYKLMYGLNNAYEAVELMGPALEEIDLLQSVINELTSPDDTLSKISFSGERAKGATQVLDSFFSSKSCQSAPSASARKELIKKAVAPVILSAFFTEKNDKKIPVKKITETLEKTIEAKESFLAAFKKSRFYCEKEQTELSSLSSVSL